MQLAFKLSFPTYYTGLLPYLFIDMETEAEHLTYLEFSCSETSEAPGQGQEKLFPGSKQIRLVNHHIPMPYTQCLFSWVKTIRLLTQISVTHMSHHPRHELSFKPGSSWD